MLRVPLRLSSLLLSVHAALGAAAPDFGPNVFIFDPSTPAESIQRQVDTVFHEQEKAQFGRGRYAFLFRPGHYDANVRVGFYTQVLGLGASPDDVVIRGHVSVDARWARGMALVNFWRGAENVCVDPAGGREMWAVSQASPLRRMHIKGDLTLYDGGWSSGGFLGDSVVDGTVVSGTQQQWLTRNSALGGWTGSNWNMVFVGVVGAPAETFPQPPDVTVERSPVIREKPFLQVNADGGFAVSVPALCSDARGPGWPRHTAEGTIVPLDHFYVAHESRDTADSLNAALREGRNLLFTPGIYHIDAPLHVTRPGTVLLGLGLATLVAENGTTLLKVDDVDAVSIAGLLFEAGPVNSPVLIEVGPPGSAASHARSPTTLHDVFVRVGGGDIGKATASVVINSHDVIGDDLWLWRADHGRGVGWTVNPGDEGLVVNGTGVTMYGLAVEHYRQYQTTWNADGGRTYFYQCEIPYDVPDQAAWNPRGHTGYSGYKVADPVRRHEAHGLGVYCNFVANRAVTLGSAIEVPHAAGIRIHAATAVSLGGKGEITHVVNDAGETAGPTHWVSTLLRYP